MELNTKYITNATVSARDGVVSVIDYKGDTLLSMVPGTHSTGDLVAVVSTHTGRNLFTLRSRFELDTLLKRRFLNEINTLLARNHTELALTDYGIWYRDPTGVEYLGNTQLQ